MDRTILTNMLSNNRRALIIHVGVCFILFLPLSVIMGPGNLWTESMLERGTLWTLVSQWFAIGIYTIVGFLLYFGLGRKFLSHTHNLLANLFSVVVVPISILLGLLVVFLSPSPAGQAGADLLGLLAVPILPISESIYFFTRIGQVGSYMVMALLPPFAMWLGLATKRKNPKIINSKQSF